MSLWVQSRVSQHVCVWCRDVLAPDDAVRCGGCQAGYHHECAEQVAACGVLGCAEAMIVPVPAPLPESVIPPVPFLDAWWEELQGSWVAAVGLCLLPTALLAAPIIALLATQADVGVQALELGAVVLLMTVPMILSLFTSLLWTIGRRALTRSD